MGYQGAGFDPILLSSYTYFMIAEHELQNNGNVGAAKDALDNGIGTLNATSIGNGSFDIVAAFGADAVASAGGGPVAIDFSAGGNVDDYTTEIDNRWAAASTTAEYQNIISMEYYLALWPNGLEAYNLMRRTGSPNEDNNLQPTRSNAPGNWYASFLYPSNMVERNSSIDQKPNRLVTTFWDDGTFSTTDFNF